MSMDLGNLVLLALGAVPVGKLVNFGTAGKTAIRERGAGMATGELAARTYIDEGRTYTGRVSEYNSLGGLFGAR